MQKEMCQHGRGCGVCTGVQRAGHAQRTAHCAAGRPVFFFVFDLISFVLVLSLRRWKRNNKTTPRRGVVGVVGSRSRAAGGRVVRQGRLLPKKKPRAVAKRQTLHQLSARQASSSFADVSFFSFSSLSLGRLDTPFPFLPAAAVFIDSMRRVRSARTAHFL